MTALTTRDALAKALASWLCMEKHGADDGGHCVNCLSRAEHVGATFLLTGGGDAPAVIDAATLADDTARLAVVRAAAEALAAEAEGKYVIPAVDVVRRARQIVALLERAS